MTENTPYLFQRTPEGLVRINPTSDELKAGRRMATTLRKMLTDAKRNKQTSTSYDSVIGRIEIVLASRGKRQYLNIKMPNGELADYDVRNFLVLAIQYLTGEYPYLITNFERIEAVITLPSGRGWFQATGLV